MNKHNKIFSGINFLPRGNASDKLYEGCLVVEGGAFRGVHTNGLLDAMMENDINLSTAIGVSAGAMNAYNYISGQIGRSARINLRYRHDSRYVGTKAFLRNRGVIGFDFLFGAYNDEDPFDEERFNDPRRRFIAEATDCKTGNPIYFEKGKCSNIEQAIRASASMPYFSHPVKLDGYTCLDGGCSCKVPYQWAIDQGFDKIVVVRTRSAQYRNKKASKHATLSKTFFPLYPNFAKSFAKSEQEYNKACKEMNRLHKEGRIFVIYPSENINVGRLEKDVEKLGHLYYKGYNDLLEQLDDLKAYLDK